MRELLDMIRPQRVHSNPPCSTRRGRRIDHLRGDVSPPAISGASWEGDLLRCRTEETSGAVVVYVEGEVDLSTHGILQAALKEAVPHKTHIVVDLSGARYLDMVGVRVLEEASRACAAGGHLLLVTEPSPVIRQVLEIVGLSRVAPVLLTHAEALEAIRKHPSS